MKKIFILLLFCLPILRGASSLNAQDSLRIKAIFQLTDTTCHYTYRVTLIAEGSTLPNRFVLDTTEISLTGIYENVSPGYHLVTVTDALGKVGEARIFAPFSNFNFDIHSEPADVNPCDTANLDYRIIVTNGKSPYTFQLNNDPTIITNSTLHLNAGLNRVYVTDANNCTGFIVINTYDKKDWLNLRADFLPNSCDDSLGTLNLHISKSNPNILYPLSISLNGRPFSTDSIFKNIKVDVNGSYFDVRVKTLQGCDLVGRVFANRSYEELFVHKYPTCANRFGRGNAGISVYNGTPPYRYTSNLIGEIPNIEDIPTGIHNITVTDALGCKSSIQINLTTCVWAGDTDTSGVVNNNDLLNIGLAYGETGVLRCNYPRPDSCIFWRALNAQDWSKQTLSQVNLKHIDTNGDGIINYADTLAITRNWSKIRNLVPSPVLNVRSATPLFIQTSAIGTNQTGAFPVMLGDAAIPTNDVYGLAFSINYDHSVIEASSVYFSYNQTWLGADSDLLSISQNNNGHLDIGLTKINHSNSSGKGQIGTVHFKVKSGVANKPLNFNISQATLINNVAQVIPINPQNTSTTVTNIDEPDWAAQLSIYPNPSSKIFTIEIQDVDIQQVSVLDISGKIVFHVQNFDKNTPLSIEQSGTFFLKIQTDKGVITRKIVRL